MSYRDPEKRKEYNRKYWQEHKKELAEYRRTHREQIRANHRKWSANNQEKIREYNKKNAAQQRRRELSKRYGMTPAECDALLAAQGGHCAICARVHEDNGKKLGVDHDHQTGQVRGILCSQHNFVLGLVGDDLDTLVALVEYLKRSRNAES